MRKKRAEKERKKKKKKKQQCQKRKQRSWFQKDFINKSRSLIRKLAKGYL